MLLGVARDALAVPDGLRVAPIERDADGDGVPLGESAGEPDAGSEAERAADAVEPREALSIALSDALADAGDDADAQPLPVAL